MRARSVPFALVLLLAGAVPAAHAQASADRARLTFGMGLGYSGGSGLWTQPGQELLDYLNQADTATIAKEVRPSLGIVFLGAYFPNDHWGLTGEAHLVGLKYQDACRLVTNSGSSQNKAICDNLQGRSHPGTAVTLSVGAIFRLAPREVVSPYLRANVGINISQTSSIQTIGTWNHPVNGEEDYVVYDDPTPRTVTPAFAFGGGFTTKAGAASQFRFEARDNLIFLDKVIGTSAYPGAVPPHKVGATHILSITLGLEIVLERRRGRRY
ncbi:MAG TPA: hypothetical protein VFS28_02865 [Gemmatimonadales bacterium]|nr:hypothetical protein [Gemmatimonadales bacterium]